LGYSLLAENRLQEAIEAMKLELQKYPKFWNAHGTLAEMYALLGEKQLAIQNYEKSVELNPGNQNAIRALKMFEE
jgi:Tfp pilus assembly protein PilF